MEGDKSTKTPKSQQDKPAENEAFMTVPPGKMKMWTVSSVVAFVSAVTNNDEYGQRFRKNKVNGERLAKMTPKEMLMSPFELDYDGALQLKASINFVLLNQNNSK